MNTHVNAHESIDQKIGLLDTLKEKVKFDDMVIKAHESKDMLIDVALYGVIGLLVGYLLKRYSIVVLVAVLMSTALFLLQHIEIVHVAINWTKVHEHLGLPQTALMLSENVPALLWECAKNNMIIVISSVVGFLLGLKIG